LVLCAAAVTGAAEKGQLLVYFGTYTGKKSKGIYVSRLDTGSGKLSAPELAAEITSPSFLAVHPNERFLYAVNEVSKFDGKPAGAVSAFAIDRQTGRLSLLNQHSSGGPGPCHLVVDKSGRNVLVANYGGGSVAALPVAKDGSLREASAFVQHKGSSVNPQRQEGPHAHGIYLDSANRFAFAPDLGLDKVLIYRFDARKGTLTPNDPPAGSVAPGAGPRHFALHPHGRFAYVITEMQCTVTAFACDSRRGELKEIQTISSLPAGESVRPDYSTAELFAHPSGKFLYGSNRGHDTIAVFAIDAKTGKLSLVEHVSTQGKIPRSFGIDPSGRWLLAANQNSDRVVVFRIDASTGRLTPAGQTVEVGAPVSVQFVAAR
jgi:6-phosphogluconolactonase